MGSGCTCHGKQRIVPRLLSAGGAHGGLELHCSERFREAPLLRGEAGDGILEFLGRRNLIHEERNYDLIFVLEDNCILGIKRVGPGELPNHEHEARKLLGSSEELVSATSTAHKTLPKMTMKVSVATKLDGRGGIYRKAHGAAFAGDNIARRSDNRTTLASCRAYLFDGKDSIRRVIWSPNSVGEWLRKVCVLEENPSHLGCGILVEIGLLDRPPNGTN